MSGYPESAQDRSSALAARAESGTKIVIEYGIEYGIELPPLIPNKNKGSKTYKPMSDAARLVINERKKEMRNGPPVTFEELRELFDYDDEQGCLRWRDSPKFNMPAGSIAGYLKGTTGYHDIMIKGKAYGLHRIIFMWRHGYMPENVVDHRDRNPLNNRISNLREVSIQCNNRNCNVRVDNKARVIGVYFHKQSRKWEASVRVMSKATTLVRTSDFVEAVAHRLAAEQQLNYFECSTDSTAYQFMQKYLKEKQCTL